MVVFSKSNIAYHYTNNKCASARIVRYDATVMLTLAIAVSIFLECALFFPVFWPVRRVWAYPMAFFMVALAAMSTYSIGHTYLSLFVILLLVFRGINFLRIGYNRMNEKYMRMVCLRTSLWLVFFQVILLILGSVQPLTYNTQSLPLLAIAQLVFAATVLVITTANVIKSKLPRVESLFSSEELPTVTVAVPARNETTELKHCLSSLLASDYPKLEILVLDDCSQDSTPEIIKKFAHDGVRFIQGSPPDDDWLPKNAAYQRLTEEASGEYILFCGVDTKFEPATIRILVSIILIKRSVMLSVLPLRLTFYSAGALIQPMRYWWELSLPRWLFHRPPVLSTCWVIKKKSLISLGGFQAVRRSILPERFFAREFAKQRRYQFYCSNAELGIQTLKPIADQRQTALRVRYPQIHRRPELVLLLTLTQLLFLMGPFIVIVACLISHTFNTTLSCSIAAAMLLIVNHILIVGISNPANVPVALFNLPLALLVELFVGLLSMCKYEFGQVQWKDRNVCIPVMHAYPKLPKLD